MSDPSGEVLQNETESRKRIPISGMQIFLIIRLLFFFGLLGLGLFGIYFANSSLLAHLINAEHILVLGPLQRLLVWLSLSLQFMIGVQILAPPLILLLLPHERIRDPKQIIRYGEKFRDLNLSTPTFILLDLASWPSLLQGLIGFFSLPKPLHSLVVLKVDTIKNLSPEEFDFLVFRMALLGKKSFQGKILFWMFFLIPLTFHMHIELALLALFTWIAILVLREWTLDHMMILSLEGLPSHYWSMLRKLYGNFWVPEFRRKRYFEFKTPFWLQRLHYLPVIFWTLCMMAWPLGKSKVTPQASEKKTNSAVLSSISQSHQTPPTNLSFNSDGSPVPTEDKTAPPSEKSNELVSRTNELVSDLGLSATPSPLLAAAAQGTPQQVYDLTRTGANLLVTDENGNTILHYALKNPRRKEMLSYLLQSKALDPDKKNLKGLSVEEILKQARDEDLGAILRNRRQ